LNAIAIELVNAVYQSGDNSSEAANPPLKCARQTVSHEKARLPKGGRVCCDPLKTIRDVETFNGAG
jgi:hypothetical protein